MDRISFDEARVQNAYDEPEPLFEKSFTAAASDAINTLITESTQTSVTERVGSVILRNGKKAQIHLTVTTDEEDFLDLIP